MPHAHRMAAFSFVLCFLLLQVIIGVYGEEHTVTVITDPPSGPFLIRNRINFTCHVYPMPSEPVTYSWHAVKDVYGPTTLSGQCTIHYTPYQWDLHFSWFFCKVFSNKSLVGVGRTLVEIHGFVFSVEPLFRTFFLGSTIELQVNVSTDYVASHIETLTWYHNEIEILSSNRVSVLNSGRSIIIRDATHADAGNYKVEIASFDHHDDDPVVCDSLWLPLLRHHAAYAPVTFTLNRESPSSSADHHSYMKSLPLQYYPLVNGDISTLLTISHDTNLSSSWTFNIINHITSSNYVSSSLSVNGSSLVSDPSKFNLSQTAMESGTLRQVINFQYNYSDEGFYIHSLYFRSFSLNQVLRDQGYACYRYAEDRVYRPLHMIPLAIFPFILTTYKPPSQINISINFASSGLTALVCMAIGGVPDSHNITLFHSNQPISTSRENNKLQAYIANNSLLGEFTCIVESLYSTKRVSILWDEKASFQLLLAENKEVMCIHWKVNRSAVYEDITSLFKMICDCLVDLESMNIDCLMTGNIHLSGTIKYSNQEGNITPSTLIDMLQVWLLTSTDPIIMVQDLPFKLITQCPVKLTPTTVEACSNLKVTTPATSESAVIGGSFIGGVLIGILACLVILCIGLCMLKLKADISMRRAGSISELSQTVKEEEIVMGTNQAYETVEMHYESASRYQQPASGPQENTSPEPDYEN